MNQDPLKPIVVFIASMPLVALILILPAAKRGAPFLQVWAQEDASSPVRTPDTAIANWPPESKQLAKVFIDQYGQPTRFEEDSLVWEGNSPWKRTVIHRSPWMDASGAQRVEILEQTISYRAPRGEQEDLASFDRKIAYDERAHELTSGHETERLNYLALNLAEEIITGVRTPTQARAAYRKELQLMQAGKTSAYTAGLRFAPPPPVDQ